MTVPQTSAAQNRLLQIERARQAVMQEGRSMTDVLVHGWYDGTWIERSWRRCLENGRRPTEAVRFDVVAAQQSCRVEEANHVLVSAARQMVAGLANASHGPVHCSELFAQPCEPLYDIARASEHTPVELPLWSGLRLSCLAQAAGTARTGCSGARLPLRDVEIALIRKAVNDARGNVMEAARALGISRATVYRKLSQKPPARA